MEGGGHYGSTTTPKGSCKEARRTAKAQGRKEARRTAKAQGRKEARRTAKAQISTPTQIIA
ncbi:MAG: hypothetical protein AAB579_01185 [Patescibacteria group bacterium]